MRLSVTFLVFVAVPTTLAFFGTGFPDEMYARENECMKQSGIDREQLEKLRTHFRIFPPQPLAVDNELNNQWVKCMMQKYNVIKADDTVNMDGWMTITIPDDTMSLESAFQICKNKIGKDIADTARLMWDCYRFNSSGILMLRMSPEVYYANKKPNKH